MFSVKVSGTSGTRGSFETGAWTWTMGKRLFAAAPSSMHRRPVRSHATPHVSTTSSAAWNSRHLGIPKRAILLSVWSFPNETFEPPSVD